MSSLSCPHCGIRLNSGIIRMISHIYAFHGSMAIDHRFILLVEEQQLILEVIEQPSLNVVNLLHPQQTSYHSSTEITDHQNLVGVFSHVFEELLAKGFSFSGKDSARRQVEDRARRLMRSKVFYHGPQRHFKPMKTPEEFLNNSDEEVEPNFESFNEQTSLLNDITEESPDKQAFWTLWNNTIMDHRTRNRFTVLQNHNLLEMIDEVINRLGNEKTKYHLVLMEHLATLLTYQCLTPKQFASFIEKI